ncbi:hypothetical protein BO82DRAFT_426641, partial [Aspergillus uvarum CBS 121591]
MPLRLVQHHLKVHLLMVRPRPRHQDMRPPRLGYAHITTVELERTRLSYGLLLPTVQPTIDVSDWIPLRLTVHPRPERCSIRTEPILTSRDLSDFERATVPVHMPRGILPTTEQTSLRKGLEFIPARSPIHLINSFERSELERKFATCSIVERKHHEPHRLRILQHQPQGNTLDKHRVKSTILIVRRVLLAPLRRNHLRNRERRILILRSGSTPVAHPRTNVVVRRTHVLPPNHLPRTLHARVHTARRSAQLLLHQSRHQCLDLPPLQVTLASGLPLHGLFLPVVCH